ncbi:MAG: ribosome silencing factor [Planctomycetota bacterium]|jgi:ribosome-associated protein|nr:ribosome silencing factor [Planctomycetota bacterium]
MAKIEGSHLRKNLARPPCELAVLAAIAMHEQRADDILVLDLRGLVDYTDFFVIGSADSLARLRGIFRRVDLAMREGGGNRLNRADKETGWLLADFGEVLIHLFERRARDFYRLEELWGDAPRIEWREGPAGRKGTNWPG